MSDYEPMIVPHWDGWKHTGRDVTPDGWRPGLLGCLVESVRAMPAAQRKGALSILYALRAMAEPPAFQRALSTFHFQRLVSRALLDLDAPASGAGAVPEPARIRS